MLRKTTEVGYDTQFTIRFHYADNRTEEFGFCQGLEDNWWQGDYESWTFNMLEEVTKHLDYNPEYLEWETAIVSFFDYNDKDGIEVHRIYVTQGDSNIYHEVTKIAD